MPMNNIVKKLSDEEYENNFADINPPLSEHAAIGEASRCIYCYDAPCTLACPTHIDVPAFIKKITTRNYAGSAKTILDSNILGGSCARVCPVNNLCEGACVIHKRGETPIQIGKLQRFATDWTQAKGFQFFSAGEPNGKKVGIIGAGPAGLSCAADLAKWGYEVTIYDAKEEPGGLDTYGIAPYKMRKKDVLREIKIITDLGVKIVNNTIMGKDKSFEELAKENDAVFIGIGLWNTHRLNIPGNDLDGVFDALNWIEKIKDNPFHAIDVGKRVAVIGAGNTSIDAATEAKRLGAEEVMIIYRRSEAEMPAYEHEYNLAKMDGIIFHWQTSPIEILGTKAVEGLKCIRMKLGEPDATGRRRPEPIAGSDFILEVDMVIETLGQKGDADFLSTIEGLEVEKGLIKINETNGQTSIPYVFAGGDCVNGAKEVVNAVQEGKRAARGIHDYLSI